MGLGDELSKFIPKDFGKKSKKKDAAGAGNAGSNSIRKPDSDTSSRTPPATGVGENTDKSGRCADQPPHRSEDRGVDVGDADDGAGEALPASQHAVMAGHRKAVSAIAWDPSGDVLASGEHGANMLLWDFPSMDRALQSFRTVVPYEGQQIHAAKFNPEGTLLVCATGDPRAKLFTPEGTLVAEFKRGDMYVMDMRRTTGHVSALTSVDWSPHGDRLVTAGADSTLRFWHCERPQKQEQVVVAKTATRGARVAVTACAYSADGRVVASAQQDGHVSLWPTAGPFLRPAQHVAAHTPGSEPSAVAFVPGNDRHLVSRGATTVKLWDVRQMATPLAVAENLPSAGPESNIAFSPSGRLLLTGVASGGAAPSASATAAVLDTADLSERRRARLPVPGDVLSIAWHPRLDQIAAGLTTGDIVLLYDPERSSRGATLCMRKQQRRQAGGVSTVGPIITPHALPLFRDEKPASAKRRRDDLARSQKPREPVHGHGKGGVIGVNATQHIMKSLIKDTIRDEDPREALLKYAAVAESDPKFIAPSYKKTQAKPVFDDTGASDVPEMKRRK
ncbi:hypothetical protein LPJ61_004123 [Coemansia biformis]|uniref:WD40 repeat-like protein n=1 Tax=Coemansia biformis TaxID=1286918 RepID=A0A9W7YA39_9FUNG|nr:hypothetical protein LPJ61_004123 [Coemansia biformis]